jgi:hypothetical protein
MNTQELLHKISLFDEEKKQTEKIVLLFEKGYVYISVLQDKSLDKSLTTDFVNEAEQFFIANQVELEKLDVSNQFLKKYCRSVQKFWSSFEFYNYAKPNQGKFNLFDKLKENLQKPKGQNLVDEMNEILKNLESLWVSSNQIFTKYIISSLRKKNDK